MRAGSMNALIGADKSIKGAEVPMKAYREARLKGDTSAMERALGYAAGFAAKAEDYSKKAGVEILKERRAENKQKKLEREEAIEKAREERKATEEKIEAKNSEKLTDIAEISENGKAAAEKLTESAIISENKEIYTESGKTVPLENAGTSIEAKA